MVQPAAQVGKSGQHPPMARNRCLRGGPPRACAGHAIPAEGDARTEGQLGGDPRRAADAPAGEVPPLDTRRPFGVTPGSGRCPRHRPAP